MKFGLLLLLVAGVSEAIYLAGNKNRNAAQLDLKCMAQHCTAAVVQCNMDTECRKMLFCTAACFGDETCQMKCSLVHGMTDALEINTRAQAFLRCLHRNKCWNLPTGTDKCPAPSNPVKQYNLADMLGEWWVEYGWSRVYDCWPCQLMAFTQRNDSSALDYRYDMVVGQQRQLRSIPCTVEQHIFDSAALSTHYRVLDVIDGHDSWYVMEVVDDKYMLLYYCGFGELASEYQGAIIMVRKSASYRTSIGEKEDGAVPKNVLQRFEIVLKQSGTGVELSKFCHNEIFDCPQNNYVSGLNRQ